MIRYLVILVALTSSAACGERQAEDNAATAAGQEVAAKPSDNASNASNAGSTVPVQGPGIAAGQRLRVLRVAPCVEVGAGASDEPWMMKKDSFVIGVGSEGSHALIETAPGMPACRIALDAVGPA